MDAGRRVSVDDVKLLEEERVGAPSGKSGDPAAKLC
jgi:hypothetical protein